MSKVNKDRLLYLLYCSLRDELSIEQKGELDRILPFHPDIETEKTWLQEMIQLLEKRSQKTFSLGFAERVLNGVRTLREEKENVFDFIVLSFHRIAFIGIIFIIVLAFANTIAAKDVSIESLLAFPKVSLENTLYLDSIFQGEKNAQ